jgi:hypothetical protein
MQENTPEQVHELWTRAFTAHDLPELLALYKPDVLYRQRRPMIAMKAMTQSEERSKASLPLSIKRPNMSRPKEQFMHRFRKEFFSFVLSY